MANRADRCPRGHGIFENSVHDFLQEIGSPDQRPAGFLSSTSCRRSGNLSILRVISRTSHGSGLRMTGDRSLSISTRLNPRGRNRVRHSVFAAGSVSVTKMTSRISRLSRSRSNNSICCRKLGSLGLSAKTTIGRWTYNWSANTVSAALTGPNGAGATTPSGVVAEATASWAEAANGRSADRTRA
jgi:hypothetical protein